MIKAHYEDGVGEGLVRGIFIGFLAWMLIYVVAGWMSQ